ncbi:alpha/beta hydrolase [Actinomadura fulvescens]|uniref:alpha/beta hydrolase n=1 Tax=Actinomadura fulvescens TaxID=46160 RepID=UPI0031DC2902
MVPLLTDSHRVIRIDLLGHGQSAKPADRSYATRDQARRVGAALDRLGVRRATVVGHSSGGVVATALAEQRPDLLTALALINTGPSLDAYIASASATIDPSQWPPSDEQIRRFASTGFSRAGYQMLKHLREGGRARARPGAGHRREPDDPLPRGCAAARPGGPVQGLQRHRPARRDHARRPERDLAAGRRLDLLAPAPPQPSLLP